jgi:hypothetical protein
MRMTKARRRLFDTGLILLGCVLAVAALIVGLPLGAAARMLAMSVITWLMCSLPVAILIGHCALGED